MSTTSSSDPARVNISRKHPDENPSRGVSLVKTTNKGNKTKVVRKKKETKSLEKPLLTSNTNAQKIVQKRISRRPSRSRKRKYSKKKTVRPISYLDPAIWGPAGWTFLHAITFEFPERPTYENRLSMSMLMWSVADLLPCQQCCDEFTSVLEEYAICPDCPIIKGGRSVLAPWLVKVHNEVNERLDKPYMSYSKVQKLYYDTGEVDCDEYKN
mgnify:CR=1 FL=1